MPKNFNPFTSNLVRLSIFSTEQLKRDALSEQANDDKETTQSSSQEGAMVLTPFNDKASKAYRYFLHLKNQNIDDLVAILEKQPSVANLFFKHLLLDESKIKTDLLSKLGEKLNFAQVLRDEKTLEAIQKSAPKHFNSPMLENVIPMASRRS